MGDTEGIEKLDLVRGSGLVEMTNQPTIDNVGSKSSSLGPALIRSSNHPGPTQTPHNRGPRYHALRSSQPYPIHPLPTEQVRVVDVFRDTNKAPDGTNLYKPSVERSERAFNGIDISPQ